MSENLNTAGRELFPEYPRIHGMYAREVEGLTDEQIDSVRPEKTWGAWPIRRQVSHIASVHYRWYLTTWGWGEVLSGGSPLRDPSLAETGEIERALDPKRFHEMSDLLAAVKDSLELVWEILEGETLGGMRERVQQRRIAPDDKFPTGESRLEWTRNVVLKAHPGGFRQDEADPEIFHYDLEYTFRHTLWESYAHLRTIQAHKEAMGLPPANEIPVVGYLKVLRWE